MQKTAVSSPRSDGFSVKKRRFLKLIRIFVGIKKVYHLDCQPLLSNAKNKPNSMLFRSKNGGSFLEKHRFYRQET